MERRKTIRVTVRQDVADTTHLQINIQRYVVHAGENVRLQGLRLDGIAYSSGNDVNYGIVLSICASTIKEKLLKIEIVRGLEEHATHPQNLRFVYDFGHTRLKYKQRYHHNSNVRLDVIH